MTMAILRLTALEIVQLILLKRTYSVMLMSQIVYCSKIKQSVTRLRIATYLNGSV